MRHCICFTVKLDLKTWSPRALKTACQRCQRKQTRCPARPCPGWSQVGWSLIYRFGFHPENEENVSCAIFIQYTTPCFLLYFHPCATASCRFPLRTYLCMNDCTLPIHLNSVLHITSTLIWASKCVFCISFFFFIYFLFFIAVHVAVVVP